MKTVKEDTSSSRPSVMCIIATDWVTDGCLLPEIYRDNLQTKRLPYFSTHVALAHWIYGDDTFSHGGLLLCVEFVHLIQSSYGKNNSPNDKEILTNLYLG